MGNTISYQEAPHELNLGDKGSLLGVQLDDKARRYLGVPYALPPTGDYRWRKPRPLPPSHVYQGNEGEPFNATRFKPICPQKVFHVVEGVGSKIGYSEDCLVVNIWTPVEAAGIEPQKKWPVMLWLHGGWFQMGDPSHEPGMDPTEMISTGGLNAIVVAIGYRLNVFGFLAGEALMKESDGESGGNFGLFDQRLAMEWVRENIEAFGGDPGNITLAGRSAGAYSAEAQVLYEFRKPGPEASMFHRVFMDSNAIPAQPKSLEDAEEQFNELCTHFEIDSSLSGDEKLRRLRGVHQDDLINGTSKLKNHTFRPVTDNVFIHPGMIRYLGSKEFADRFKKRGLKLLIGEVLNEETLYSTYNSPEEATLEALRSQVGNYYAPDTTDRVLDCYDLPSSSILSEWKNTFGQIISDGQVRAPSRALVKSLVENGVDISDIWRYQIAYRLSFIDDTIAPRSFGVAHAMDKPFWNFSVGFGPTPKERNLMEDWIQILVSFVNNDHTYNFGTTSIEEMKIATPQGRIEIQKDARWDELTSLGAVFGSEARQPTLNKL